MTVDHILTTIDAEIARLQEARAVLAGIGARGSRPVTPSAPKKRRKRGMSAEGRKRIAEAQRKRWAAQKSR